MSDRVNVRRRCLPADGSERVRQADDAGRLDALDDEYAPRPGASLLSLVCDRCATELDVAHVTVAATGTDGFWSAAHSTSDTAATLGEQAYVLGEGPCRDALHDRAPVIVRDLDSPACALRWPVWSPGARAAGIRSVAAFPVRAGSVLAGVLILLFERSDPLDPVQIELSLRLADMAFLGLTEVLALGAESSSPSRSAGCRGRRRTLAQPTARWDHSSRCAPGRRNDHGSG